MDRFKTTNWRMVATVVAFILLYGVILLNHGTQVQCPPSPKQEEFKQLALTGLSIDKACPRRTANVAIVMPFQSHRIQHVLLHVSRWNESWCLPCTPDQKDPKVEMIFLHDWDLTEIDYRKEVEEPIMEILAASPEIEKCFKSIKFISTETRDPDNQIMRQITEQFYGAFELLQSEDLNYFFLMEADTIPVRPNWANQVYLEAACGPDFWIKGSVHRNALRSGVKEFGFHINGNALYKTCKGDDACSDFFMQAFDITYGAPYDYILWRELHLVNSQTYRNALHMYQYSEFVQNQYHNTLWKVPKIVASSPSTYFVHGKRFVLPDGTVINLKEKKKQADEPPVDDAKAAGGKIVDHQIVSPPGEPKNDVEKRLTDVM